VLCELDLPKLKLGEECDLVELGGNVAPDIRPDEIF